MILGENAADLGRSAVFVVGGGLYDDRHPARTVTLVNDLFVVGSIEALARPALDRALNVVVGHALGASGLDRAAQARIPGRISSAAPGRDRDFLRKLAKELTALRVDRSLETLYLRPFT